MAVQSDILISVEGRHASSMLNGRKTVELRRRAIQLETDSRVWIYSKVPRGYVEAVATVDKVVSEKPSKLWELYGHCSAISKIEFDAYFENSPVGFAIIFKDVKDLKPILSLVEIRNLLENFQPPQFFKRLNADSPELEFFRSALA